MWGIYKMDVPKSKYTECDDGFMKMFWQYNQIVIFYLYI